MFPTAIYYPQFSDTCRLKSLCTFDDIAKNIQAAYSELGHNIEIHDLLHRKPDCERPLILAANIVNLLPVVNDLIPSNAIVYNFEQLAFDDEWRIPEYLGILSRVAQVWDYSAANVRWLASQNIESFYVAYGASGFLKPVTKKPAKNTWLFIGLPHERRRIAIEYLFQCGQRVHGVSGFYSDELTPQLETSEAVLSIHAKPKGQFDVVRHIHVWAAGLPILAEYPADYSSLPGVYKRLTFHSYANLNTYLTQGNANKLHTLPLMRDSLKLIDATKQSNAL